MAGLVFTATTAEIAMVAATAKTILMIKTAAQQRGKLKAWGVFFDGISASAEPILVELCHASTDGTGAASPPSGIKVDESQGETIQSTITHNFSSEPTVTVIERKEVHPQSGYEKIYPYGDERRVKGAGRVCIKVTSPAVVNAVGWMEFEE
jgi:hypothetical protein